MAIFDQRNRRVAYQYNAAGDINFGAVQNRLDLAGEIDKLRDEVLRAGQAAVLDTDAAADVEHHLKTASSEARKAEPDKQRVLGGLSQAKSLLQTASGSVTAVAGLISAVTKAAEVADKLF